MAEPRPEKVAAVEELEKRLRGAEVVILTDYRGLTVDEIGALRARLRDLKVDYRVAKNTLLGIAAERCGVKDLSRFLTGPTAVVFGHDDPGVPARVLQEFIRQYRKLEIKGGMVAGEMLDADGVRALATLPTRAELLARIVGMVQAPLRMMVTVLNSPARGLVTALDALRAKRSEGGEVPAPAGAEQDGPAAAAPPAAGQGASATAAQGAPATAAQGVPATAVQGVPVRAGQDAPAIAAAGGAPAAPPDQPGSAAQAAPEASAQGSGEVAAQGAPATAAQGAPAASTEAGAAEGEAAVKPAMPLTE